MTELGGALSTQVGTQTLDLRIGITAAGGRLPMAMTGYILSALCAAYPGMQLATTSRFGEVLSLHIPAGDYLEPATVDESTLANLVPDKEDPDLVAFTSGLAEGALKIGPPPWLSELLLHAAQALNAAIETAGAPNYLTLDLFTPDGSETFTWIICRPGHPSPHELRQLAEARAEQLEKQLRDHGIKPARRPRKTATALGRPRSRLPAGRPA
jgi:hypothetical protein